jgi:hypothetical protein
VDIDAFKTKYEEHNAGDEQQRQLRVFKAYIEHRARMREYNRHNESLENREKRKTSEHSREISYVR